jgi:hypothetical protein
MNAKQSSNTRQIQRLDLGRGVLAAAVAAAAVFAVSGQSQAALPGGDGPVGHVTTTQGTVMSPCFAVRAPDRWGSDAGSQPRCAHVFGTSTSYPVEGISTGNYRATCFDSLRTYPGWMHARFAVPRCDETSW